MNGRRNHPERILPCLLSLSSVSHVRVRLSVSAWRAVVGPDGNLWFTEAGADKIGRITTTGVLTEYPIPTTGGALFDLAVGPDGGLWFTEANGNAIARLSL